MLAGGTLEERSNWVYGQLISLAEEGGRYDTDYAIDADGVGEVTDDYMISLSTDPPEPWPVPSIALQSPHAAVVFYFAVPEGVSYAQIIADNETFVTRMAALRDAGCVLTTRGTIDHDNRQFIRFLKNFDDRRGRITAASFVDMPLALYNSN